MSTEESNAGAESQTDRRYAKTPMLKVPPRLVEGLTVEYTPANVAALHAVAETVRQNVGDYVAALDLIRIRVDRGWPVHVIMNHEKYRPGKLYGALWRLEVALLELARRAMVASDRFKRIEPDFRRDLRRVCLRELNLNKPVREVVHELRQLGTNERLEGMEHRLNVSERTANNPPPPKATGTPRWMN